MSEQTTSVGTEQAAATETPETVTKSVDLADQYKASVLKDLSPEDRTARIAEMELDQLELAHKNAASSEWSAKSRYEKNQTGENHRTWATYTALAADLKAAMIAKREAAGKTVRKGGGAKNGAVVKITSSAERLNMAIIGFVASDEFTVEAKASFLEGAVAYVTKSDPKQPSEETVALIAAKAALDKIENPEVREAMAKALGYAANKVPEARSLPTWGELPKAPAVETKPADETETDPNAEEAKGTDPITGPTEASKIVAEHAAERTKAEPKSSK